MIERPIRNVSLVVKTTNRCNLNCPYCYDKLNREDKLYGNKDMSLDTVAKIATVFNGLTNNWIWHGGEPLLVGHKFFADATKIINDISKDTKIRFSMQTNGTLLKPKVIKEMKRCQINIGLSFDGILNGMTRKNTPRVMEVFEDLKKHNVSSSYIMLLTPNNIGNIIGEYEYGKELGLPQCKMNTVFKVHGVDGTKTIDGETHAEAIIKLFEHWLKDKDDVSNVMIMAYIARLLKKREGTCESGDCVGRWMSIYPNGAIHPCGRNWDKNMEFGNIHDISSVDEIYNHPNFLKFKEDTRKILSTCKKTCEFSYACNGGCFGNIYSETGKLEAPLEEHCKSTKLIFTHMYKRLLEIHTNNEYHKYNSKLQELTRGVDFKRLIYIRE